MHTALAWFVDMLHQWSHLLPLLVLTAVLLNRSLLRRLNDNKTRIDNQQETINALYERLNDLYARAENNMVTLQQVIESESHKEEDIHRRIMDVVETITNKCSTTHEMIRIQDQLMRKAYPDVERRDDG